MPQCVQKVCCATPVSNVYTVSASLPFSSSKSSTGTGRCRMPFLVHIEQLHCDKRSRSTRARKRTRPQWQPPYDCCSIRHAPLVEDALVSTALFSAFL